MGGCAYLSEKQGELIFRPTREAAWWGYNGGDHAFDEADETPEIELNEILWMSVRGATSKMPPPRRTGFIHGIPAREDK